MPSFTEKIQVAGQDMDVYSSVPARVPEKSGPFPAVVVIQAAGGVGDFIKGFADKLAGEGYTAVAPDLYHRITDPALTDSIAKARSLSDPDIVADVAATVDWLRANSAVDAERLGITGFCMGGRVTWLAAASIPHFRAAVPFYGGNIASARGAAGESPLKSPFDLSSGINCPMLFHFGELDGDPSQEDMVKLDGELTRLGKPHKFYSYPGVDHGFADPSGARYNREAAEISWARTLEFLAEHL